MKFALFFLLEVSIYHIQYIIENEIKLYLKLAYFDHSKSV